MNILLFGVWVFEPERDFAVIYSHTIRSDELSKLLVHFSSLHKAA